MIHALPQPSPHLENHAPSARAQQRILAVQQHCQRRGLKLTASRLRVLRLLAEADGPLKAYALLDSIRRSHPKAGPAAVYRALEFLQAQGWAVKLNTINAFMLRPPGPAWSCTFLVCERCAGVATLEGPALRSELIAGAHIAGFTPAMHALEVAGTCRRCRERHPDGAG